MSYGEASAAAVRERAARRAGLLSDASSAAAASYRSQRHRYVTLLLQKESAFWSKRIDAQQSQPRQLWRSFDKLLGRGKNPLSSDIDASALHQILNDKVAGVRAATARADEPRFTPAPVRRELRLFNLYILLTNQTVWKALPPTTAKSRHCKMADCQIYY